MNNENLRPRPRSSIGYKGSGILFQIVSSSLIIFPYILLTSLLPSSLFLLFLHQHHHHHHHVFPCGFFKFFKSCSDSNLGRYRCVLQATPSCRARPAAPFVLSEKLCLRCLYYAIDDKPDSCNVVLGHDGQHVMKCARCEQAKKTCERVGRPFLTSFSLLTPIDLQQSLPCEGDQLPTAFPLCRPCVGGPGLPSA